MIVSAVFFLVSKKMSNQKYPVELKIRKEEEMPYPSYSLVD
ncbi:hypothetical protein [Cytobacillus sp. HI03-3b]